MTFSIHYFIVLTLSVSLLSVDRIASTQGLIGTCQRAFALTLTGKLILVEPLWSESNHYFPSIEPAQIC
ncbi:hypothetical protein MANES_12G118807v8 [Manihot esculenta]|uniref:Uncharacterized protein n=2 Tax=Manihot esculenta TaxID=3983 RepID=A0ACB7GTE9_MANES|nr:hypothetical protein MANES_12G118807v8 [Manihot esculenta]KAG8642768.1 hypothetical protein MANES_12G118807v8 [Manihot esculenta]